MEFSGFDDDYVRRLREGDPETGEHFNRYFRDLLLVRLRRKLKSPMAIQDVIQTTFLRVLKDLGDLRDSSKLGGFVYGYCNNILKEHYREDPWTVPLDDHWEGESRDNPYEDLRLSQRRALVHYVLGELEKESPNDAKILRAIFLAEKDKAEICREFHVTPDYLRVLLHRAKEKFRALLKRLRGERHY